MRAHCIRTYAHVLYVYPHTTESSATVDACPKVLPLPQCSSTHVLHPGSRIDTGSVSGEGNVAAGVCTCERINYANYIAAAQDLLTSGTCASAAGGLNKH